MHLLKIQMRGYLSDSSGMVVQV